VAEILGLTVSHFPYMRMKGYTMPSVLRSLVGGPWADNPKMSDPKNWPEEMQREWSNDLGEKAGIASQKRQIEQFRKVRAAIDDFKPDVWVMLYRGINEPKAPERPKYWIFLQDEIPIQFYMRAGNQRQNYFEEDPEKIETLKMHVDAGEHLIKHLEAAGQKPYVARGTADKPAIPGENCVSGLIALDWDHRDFKTPIIPIGIDPFGFNRERRPVGLAPWDRNAPPPLTPAEAFTLGREIAKAFRPSPWRVALVAATNWSNAQNTFWDSGRVHPAIDEDKRRFEQWRNNEFDKWGENWTFDQMEDNAQWEATTSIVLAGAMTEIGSKVKYADLQTTYVMNSDWVTTIFEPK